MTSPTPFAEGAATCAKNAQVQPAPAAMPSEEDVARVFYHSVPRNKPWDALTHEFKNQYRKQARAVLALFAPILAEKERNIREAVAHASEGWRRAGLAQGKLEASELAGVVDGWKARALAAEAALAAEREKVAQVLEPFDDALGEDDEGYGDGLTVVMKWGACTDYSVTLADLRDVRKLAAAIRARGE